MKTLVRRSAVLALIGFVLSPLAVAHASSSPNDSEHFCQLIDFEQWQRDHPRPAGKRLALNVGEPRTVRMIYFLPNDRPFRQEVVDSMKVAIRRVQNFYAEQMQAHGYGDKTFRIETDVQGEPMVHRVDGRHPERHYGPGDMIEELREVFDFHANIYNIILDSAAFARGRGSRYSKNGGYAWLDDDYIWGSAHGGYAGVTAHEIGHAFGLGHDWRDDAYIMSYGPRPDRLSACAAEFLSVHPYFNPEIPTKEGPPPTIELISPRTYPAGSGSVSIQLKVADSQGLHQVILFGGAFYNDITVKACRELSDGRDAVVEFEYDGVIPSYSVSRSVSSLSAIAAHSLRVQVVDSEGNVAWTDFVLAEASSQLIATLEGHTNEVNSVSFSPDGTLLASGSWDGTVLWDVATREQVTTLDGHMDKAHSVSFSPDGTTLASGSSGTVILWDARTGEWIATLEGHRTVFHVEGGTDTILSYVRSVSFSPDGALLASGASDSTVKLWDVATRRQIATLKGHRSQVSSVSFSPDGTLLASGSWDRTVKLWDVATRRQIATLEGHWSWVRSVSFSPDGTLLASGSSNFTVILWDVATRRQIATLEGHRSQVSSVSFSAPDGALLATGGQGGSVILWDVLTREKIVAFGHTAGVNAVSFSPDGTTLAAGSEDGTILLWDTSERTQFSEQAIPQTLTKVSGDGQEGLAGEQLAKPFVVSVLDQDGSAFAGAVVSFSVTAGGGTLSATSVTTNANGRAVTKLRLGSEPGTNTVEATVEGLEPETFTAIGQATTDSDGDDEQADDEQAMPQSLTMVSGEGQAGQAGATLAEPFVVSVLDQNGSAYAGAVVTFSVTAGGGTLSATTATTNASGQARSTLTLGSDPGPNTVSATVAGLEPVAFTATATAIEQTPQSLTKVSGEGQAGQAGATLAAPFVVSVLDEDGAAIAGAVVTFSVTAGGGTLSSTTATTDANGRARSTLTLGSGPGTNTVTATVAELESVTFTASGYAIPHSLTKVSGEGQEGPASTQLAAPFVVSVLDEDGAAIAGASVTFSVTAGGGMLSSTTAPTDANGRARSTLTLGSQPGLNAVAATVAELESVTFTASGYATPHSLTKVSGEGQEGPASTQLAEPFVVSVLDQDGAAIAGASVTFSVTAGGGMLSSTTDANPCIVESSTSSTTATTDANGRAATRLTLGSQPGSNTIAATVEGLEPVTFTATAAEQTTSHSLTKVCGEDQEGTAGILLDKPFVVSVLDEDGAAMAGVVVTFSVTAGGGPLSSTTATTEANGRAATRLTLGSEPGTNTVEATVEGLEPVTFTAIGQESPVVGLFDLFGGGKRVALPDSPQLAQNAPNPFNSQTVLSYFLHAPGPARLEVFALTGQRVAVLHQGPQQAGYHRLRWNGRDDTGRPVASGMYLYRLVTVEGVLMRKLVLLR